MAGTASSPSGSATSVTQRVFHALVDTLTTAARPASASTTSGIGAAPDAAADVRISPLSLTRLGRSRRLGPLLDLELAVAVEVGSDDVLALTERLLLAAEAAPHLRIEPLPAQRPGFGFVVVLGVSVEVPEPVAPAVREVQVEIRSLGAPDQFIASSIHEGI